MRFKLVYKMNPLTYHSFPSKTAYSNREVVSGVEDLKQRLDGNWTKVNINRSAKRVIRGLSIQYGFKPIRFMRDNFKKQNKNFYLKSNHQLCTLPAWINIISILYQQLNQIRKYPNISTLLRSRYHKYLQINDINKIYHPRKQRVAKNARTKLKKLGSRKRFHFIGVFMRTGLKNSSQPTLLLINIKHNHHLVAHHLWLNYSRTFMKLGQLRPGNRISFYARVKSYQKGYVPKEFIRRKDYQLIYPSHAKVLDVNPKFIKPLPRNKKTFVRWIKRIQLHYKKK